MKHFIEARQDAIQSLSDPAITALTEKICLIVDLKGKCWILAKIKPNGDREKVTETIRQVTGRAADVFWQDKILVEDARPDAADRAIFEAAWKESRPEPAGQDRIFVLDRRLSKDAWLGAPIQPPWPLNDQTPPIISFYSFKGGVGRTTALLALALNLAQAGKKTIVIDFDLEAPGAGLNLPPAPGVPPGLGILDFLISIPPWFQKPLWISMNFFMTSTTETASKRESQSM